MSPTRPERLGAGPAARCDRPSRGYCPWPRRPRCASPRSGAAGRSAAKQAFRQPTRIDESHAQLLEDRRTLNAVQSALRDLDPATVSEPSGTFIGPLAGKLAIRPATLRKWERAGLVHPRRDPLTGYRVYDEADVRDARLAHQLSRGGYLLEQIAPLIAQVRTAGGLEPLEAALRARCWPGPPSWRHTSSSADETSAASQNPELADGLPITPSDQGDLRANP